MTDVFEKAREALRDIELGNRTARANRELQIESALAAGEEAARKAESLRGVISETFQALIRSGPAIGDIATIDLAHAVTALAAERDAAQAKVTDLATAVQALQDQASSDAQVMAAQARERDAALQHEAQALSRLSTIIDESWGPQPPRESPALEQIMTEVERNLFDDRRQFETLRQRAADLERQLANRTMEFDEPGRLRQQLAEARAETDAATLDRDKADQARKNTACAVVIAQERIAGLERRLAEVKRWAEESDAGRDREIRRASRLRSRLARVLRFVTLTSPDPVSGKLFHGVWSSKVNGGRNGQT